MMEVVVVRLLCVQLALMIAVLVCAGCGGGGGGGQTIDTSAPVIAEAKAVIPNDFSFRGGDITIRATITDQSQIVSVRALISKADATQPLETVTMSLASANTYTGTFSAPANLRSGSSGIVYSVVVVAADSSGHTSVSQPFTFQVPSIDSLGIPLPPF
jgi:hypothetical protein